MNCIQCEHGNVVGVEIPEIYDGVIYWFCLNCKNTWPRKGYEHYYNIYLVQRESNSAVSKKKGKKKWRKK